MTAMVQVLIPSQLTSYTGGATRIDAAGATVAAVLDDLDRRFPGLKFRVIDEQDRVRKHMRLFVGQAETRSVARALEPGYELLIFGALSGG
jgi:sulfur-carrier protein